MKSLLWVVAGSLLLLAGCGDGTARSTTSGSSPVAGTKNVVLLRYKAGSESTEQREKGFLETLRKEYPDINILVENEYAGTTEAEAIDKAQQIFNRFGDKIDGIFAVCEPNAEGVLKAIEDGGLGGQVKFIAFDPSERLVKAMQEGKVHGIVLQDPYKMGYTAVKTMVAHLEGQAVEKTISTGEYVATPQNMDGEDEKGTDIHQLLHPKVFSDGDDAMPPSAKYTIAVIPKGTTHVFWKSIHAGAEQAAKELGNVDVLWQGALNEADTDGQISVVQNFISRDVSGICLAPNDSQGLIEAVRSAREAGIPVVIFDSGLNDPPSYVSYVATDNYRGGVLAARRLAEVLQVKPGDSPK
jgi:ABC-type sugar transport system substrate-binding protein